MGAAWTAIMGKKTWRAMTEESCHKSVMAWNWLGEYADNKLGAKMPLEQALLSRWALPYTILVCSEAPQKALASLGHASWGVFAWPLTSIDHDRDQIFLFESSAAPQMIHITDPSAWKVIPWEAVHVAAGIGLKQTGGPIPMLCHRLRTSNTLLLSDLMLCAKHLNPDGPRPRANRIDLLRLIAASLGDDDFISEVIRQDSDPCENPEDHEEGLIDPLIEQVFEDMEPAEKTEFPEVRQAVTKQRVQSRATHHAVQVQRRKKKNQKVQANNSGRRPGQGKKRKRPQREAPDGPVEPEEPLPEEPPAAATEDAEDEDMPASPTNEAVHAEAALPQPLQGSDSGAGLPERSEEAHLEQPSPAAPAAEQALVEPGPPELEQVVPAAPERGPRAPNHGVLVWTHINCSVCGRIAGQIKFAESPGLRDPATWFMRTCAVDGSWPMKAPYFRRRVASVVGFAPDYARTWVQENRTCCPQEGQQQ